MECGMKKTMHRGAIALQTGFTLVELIIVIVIVGVLAAVAIPKFTDVTSNANSAAAQGIAGALGSASATNYALRSGIPASGSAVVNCQDGSSLLQGGLPANY